MFSFPVELLLLALALAIGYVARKFVEKKWPNEAALLDTIATRYGKQVEEAARKAKAEAQAKYEKL